MNLLNFSFIYISFYILVHRFKNAELTAFWLPVVNVGQRRFKGNEPIQSNSISAQDTPGARNTNINITVKRKVNRTARFQ